jgi:hypothetical protein
MANNKEPYIMLTLYQNLYKQKYNTAPKINKFREKWAMQDVIDSVGLERAIEIIEYYFSLQKSGHPLNFFFYNFDKMEAAIIAIKKDKEARKALLEKTKTLVEKGGIE